MTDSQQQLITELWRTASGLIDAVNRMDQHGARRFVAPHSHVDTLLDVFGIGGLVPMFYTHVPGGGHFPSRLARAGSSDVFLEVGRCRDETQPRDTAWSHIALHLRRQGRQPWLVVDLRPISLGGDFTRQHLEDLLGSEAGDTTVLKLLLGKLYMKPRKNVKLDDVEASLIDGMPKVQFGLLEQVCAIAMWRDYQRAAQAPGDQAPAAWAAAVEQVVGNLNGRIISSKRAAKMFEVDEEAVDGFRVALVKTLEIGDMDERYVVFDARASESSAAATA